jgi:hypothetical protein
MLAEWLLSLLLLLPLLLGSMACSASRLLQQKEA